MGRMAIRAKYRDDPFQLSLFDPRPISSETVPSFECLKPPPRELTRDLFHLPARPSENDPTPPLPDSPKEPLGEEPPIVFASDAASAVVPPWSEPVTPPEPEPPRNRRNYRITEQDALGTGGLKSKCRDNQAALILLKRIESEARPATDDEKRVLVRYVGWGGLPQVFDAHNDKWLAERAELQNLLTQEEWESARATTLNAHYTPGVVIDFMYAALRRFGFTDGRILEPACGLGHFVGLMPEDVHPKVQVTGIEIDGVTARLARLLYPDADIRHSPFEETKLPDQFFDVAISNIPFGDYRPYDPRFQSWKFPIHDYFFAAALEKVRPGGLITFVTSKGTFDKREGGLRDYLSQRADLVAAIRLPNDTFKENAHTEVTTDIVILHKRLPGGVPSGPAWRELAEFTNGQGETLSINEYFVKNPHLMLGEMQLNGRMYRGGEATLAGNGRPLADQLLQILSLLPRDILQPQEVTPPSVSVLTAPETIKPNAFCLTGGAVARREGDRLVLFDKLSAQMAARIKGLIRLREAVRHCLATQMEEADESKVIMARERLNQVYDRFVAQNGFISTRSNIMAFKGDPDLPLLLSLEHREDENKPPRKAALFRERTLERTRKQVEVSTAREALLVTLSERGYVDLSFLTELLPKPKSELLQELKGMVFLNPQTNQYETDDQYLSGPVKAKLAAAEAAVLIDPVFAGNVAALREVQPEDLTATEIDARLGSTWIPAPDIQQFAEELLGEKPVPVTHVPELGLWVVKGGWSARISVANTTEWGTERRGALELLEDALNLRTPTVYDEQGRDEPPVVNPTATEAARDKQQKIRDRFKGWIWEDASRCDRLVLKYNDEFNHTRLRTFNGEHLTLPGASSAVILRPHQKAAIWRILQSPNCLLAHSVGAGKTYVMVAAAMEQKRLGLARKPLMVVPNHMLGQFSTELLTLYPGANILVATKEDFVKEKRKLLMSRIATGNWDAVIVTHSGFEKIAVSRDTEREFIEEQQRELATALSQQSGNSGIIKILERAKKRLDTKLKELMALERHDDGLTFEELGVDRLYVDEAHHFKNLFYVTKMTHLSGLPQTASQRAFDMLLKVRHVQRINGGGGVVFATGTPIANSVAEMYTTQRYLQRDILKELRLEHFDSWAATFGEPVTGMELTPDGSGYRMHTRFARFINVPELMMQFRHVADIQTQAMLKLPVPRLQGGKPIIVKAPCSPELKEIVQSLVARAEALRSGAVDPKEDNMLLVTTDGRKAALDLRLSSPELPDHPTSKVNLALAQIHRIWTETKEGRGTQLVFCDLSTPTGGKGFSVYEDLLLKLLELGVPRSEMVFIQDVDSDAAKIELFRQVKAGRVRILFGSTQKMGAGMNVQERLIALHHLDAPWRPADVEQREGRIMRQGNLNPEVQIYRYVTEQSFDAFMWQTLETKAKFIAQVMTGENNLRRIEDIDGAALTYAEVKAIASGNPLVVEKATVDAEVSRLGRLESQHRATEFRVRGQIRQLTEDLPRLERHLSDLHGDLALRQDTVGSAFRIEIGGETILDRGIAGELLLRWAERIKGSRQEQRVGQFAGFVLLVRDSFMGDPEVLLRGSALYQARITETALGTMRSVEYTVQSLEEVIARQLSNIRQTRERTEDLHKQAGQPFEYSDVLGELLQRRQEIAEALDVTRTQANQGADGRNGGGEDSQSSIPLVAQDTLDGVLGEEWL